MYATYFRELRPYSEDEIRTGLGVDSDTARVLIAALMRSGILRYRTGDERGEEERVEGGGATGGQRLQFRYVGIAIVRGHAIVCYPKYLRSTDEPIREMRQARDVIARLGRDGMQLDEQEGGRYEDRLALMLRLLWFYDEYGVYYNFEETRVLNGPGVIDWSRTIDTQTPVFSDGAPIYLDFWTRKTRRDEYDLVARLHRSILSECSRFLAGCGLADLLSVGTVELTDENPLDLGDIDYLLWLIDRERAVQYATWKQDVLDLMRDYLAGEGENADESTVLRLGTTSYYHAWEVACKVAFGDLLSSRLRDLPLELDDAWHGRRSETLLQIVPRPTWARPIGMGEAGSVDTLIPDTVAFAVDGTRRLFCIYDAKYYVPSERGRMRRQPGVESVTKQFLYQTAYRDFVDAHGFNAVVNAFLVPTEDNEPRLLASVAFPEIMAAITGELPQVGDHSYMWALPAYEIFDCYLRNCMLSGAARDAVLSGSGEQFVGQDVGAESTMAHVQEPLPIG